MNLPSFFSFPKEPTLKVLRIGKIGPGGISLQRLEKLFIRLGKTKTYSLLPKELKKPRKREGRPVILLFTGGYQRFLHVIPLLDKYGLKAVLALPHSGRSIFIRRTYSSSRSRPLCCTWCIGIGSHGKFDIANLFR